MRRARASAFSEWRRILRGSVSRPWRKRKELNGETAAPTSRRRTVRRRAAYWVAPRSWSGSSGSSAIATKPAGIVGVQRLRGSGSRLGVKKGTTAKTRLVGPSVSRALAQTTDVSQGRSPDGGASPYQFFTLPTPGLLNARSAAISFPK